MIDKDTQDLRVGLLNLDIGKHKFFVKDVDEADIKLSKAISLLLHRQDTDLPPKLQSLVHKIRALIERGKIEDALKLLKEDVSFSGEEKEVIDGLTVWIQITMANWSALAETLKRIPIETPAPLYLSRLLIKYAFDVHQTLEHTQTNGAGQGLTEAHLCFFSQRNMIEAEPEIYLNLSKAFIEKKCYNADYFNDDRWVLETINIVDLWDETDRKSGGYTSVKTKNYPAPLSIENLLLSTEINSAYTNEMLKPSLAEIENVILFSGEWHIRTPEGVLISDLYVGTPHHLPNSYGSISQHGVDAMLLYRSKRPSIDSAFIAGGDDNYYHWVHDVLPRICWYSVANGINVPLLTGTIQRDFQKEILSVIGLESHDMIALPYPEVANVARAIIPLVSPQNRALRPVYGSFRRWAHDYFGNLVDPDFMTKPWGKISDGLRLYVKRGQADRRRLINEDEVCTELQRLGFQIVDPGSLGVKEQVNIFNNASVVVSLHGAALANLCFCRPGTRVAELAFPTWAPYYFRQIALERNLFFERYYLRQAPDLSMQEWFYNGYLPLDLLDILVKFAAASEELR